MTIDFKDAKTFPTGERITYAYRGDRTIVGAFYHESKYGYTSDNVRTVFESFEQWKAQVIYEWE